MDVAQHHAYLLAGDIATLTAYVHAQLHDVGIISAGNPDMHHIAAQHLSVDEVRAVGDRLHTVVPEDAHRVVLISFIQATHEAQNALLKMTEEPPQRTSFFFVVPTHDVVLPTLQSRLHTLTPERAHTTDTKQAEIFLKQSFSERMNSVADVIEEKRRDDALALCNALEEVLSRDVETNRGALKALERTRTYVLRRGSSLKLLLEYVALAMPTI